MLGIACVTRSDRMISREMVSSTATSTPTRKIDSQGCGIGNDGPIASRIMNTANGATHGSDGYFSVND